MNLRLPISDDLRREFQRSRYVVVSDALSSDVVERLRRRAESIAHHSSLIQRTTDGFTLTYRVVTGETIRDHWPDLFALYQDQHVIQWIKYITGEPAIYTSGQLQSAVNLNIMDNVDSVYRWHFDAVPYTALLYLTDVLPEDGGALEFVPNCPPHQVPASTANATQLFPTAGTLVLMDGTRCYHRAAPLLRPTVRFSVPLVYPTTPGTNSRPSGLDSYLYEPAA